MQYFHAVLLSIFLHFLIVSFVDNIPDPTKETSTPIEVIYPDVERKYRVRETENEDRNETEADKNARFKARQNKRFKEETRARKLGQLQNTVGQGGTNKPEEEIKSPGQVPKRFEPLPNPLGQLPGKPGSRPSAGILPEDIKFGDFNALNTDRYLYYSFYSRIEDRLRPRWVTNVNNVISNIDQARLRNKTWITQAEIILDKKGNFLTAIIHKKSGIDELDHAAIDAFKMNSPYQNPPLEMARDDGRIHLYYNITVVTGF